MGEEKAEAIKTHVKVDLDVKDQEDLAKTDAKTQVSSAAMIGQQLLFSQKPLKAACCCVTWALWGGLQQAACAETSLAC